MSIQHDYFTEVIDIMLYKYNSIDVKLWGIIKRDATARSTGNGSMLISKERMVDYLNYAFKQDIARFQTVSDINIHKEATSVYFIWQILQSMKNLKYIRVNINKNSSYSRIVKVDQVKTIKYSIKTVRGSIRMFDLFSPRELNLANMVLIKAGLLDAADKFKVYKLAEFLNALDLYQAENNTAEVVGVMNMFLKHLEDYEGDNPEILLITDWESDI